MGDAQILSRNLESESIDFIFTDPEYKDLSIYEWLGQEAFRLLKYDRPLMVWGSQKLVKDYIPLIEKSGMKYIWTFSYVVIAKSQRLIRHNFFTWTTPCMMFTKGNFSLLNRIPDTFVSYANQGFEGQKRHKWNKNLEVFLYWLPAFSHPGDVILDPFCGYGVTLVASKRLGRRYIGFDQAQECVEFTEDRLSRTSLDLFEEAPSSVDIF